MKPPLALSTTAALLVLCCGDGSPGDDAADSFDDSPALLGDSAVRSLCGERCYRDCELLVECGRFAGGAGYSSCVAECTGLDGLDCVRWKVIRYAS